MWYNNQTSAFYFFSLRTGIWIIIGLDIIVGASVLTITAATLGFLGLRNNRSKFIFAMWILDIITIAEFAVYTSVNCFQLNLPKWSYAIPAIFAPLWFYFGCIECSYHYILLCQEQEAAYTRAVQYLLTNPNSEKTDEQEVQGQLVDVQKVQEPLAILEPMVQEQQVQGEQPQGQPVQWEQSQEQPAQWEPVQGQPVQWEQSQEQPAQWEWEPAEEQPGQEQQLQWEQSQEQQVQEQQVQWQFSQGQQ